MITISYPRMSTPELQRRVFEATVQDKIFTVEFIKADGTKRTMNARLGVKKHLKGGTNCNTNKSMLPVYDLKAKGYRNINLESLQSVIVNGVNHTYA